MAVGTVPGQHNNHDNDNDDDGDYDDEKGHVDLDDDDDVCNDCDKEGLPVVLVAQWILHSWSVHSPLYVTFGSIGTD